MDTPYLSRIATAVEAAELAARQKATYVANGLSYGAYATPTDMLTLYGSATKTVAVSQIALAIGSTTGTLVEFFIIKRSAANTGGTSTTPTPIPYDSANGAATAVVRLYSAAPAGLGAAVGNIRTIRTFTTVLTANQANVNLNGVGLVQPSLITLPSPIILRGAAEGLAMNFAGATLPAGFSSSWAVEWTEY